MPRRPTATLLFVLCVAFAVSACTAGIGAQESLSAFDTLKARALLEQHLPCLGCHALGTVGGHVGPDLATARLRRSPQYIAAIIDDPQRVVPGSAMPKTPLGAQVRALVIRYLGGAVAVPTSVVAAPAVPPTIAATAGSNGTALYAHWCASCHGADGGGDGPNARYLPVRPAVHRDAALTGAKSDDQLFDVISAGGAAMGRSPRMPAFGATLTPVQIRALVSHLRTLCRCGQPAWAARQ